MIHIFPIWSITNKRPLLSGTATTPTGETKPSATCWISTLESEIVLFFLQLTNTAHKKINKETTAKAFLKVGRTITLMIKIFELKKYFGGIVSGVAVVLHISGGERMKCGKAT